MTITPETMGLLIIVNEARQGSNIAPEIIGFIGALIGGVLSLAATWLMNRSSSENQKAEFRNSVRMADRQFLMDLFVRMSNRYKEMCKTDEESPGSGIYISFYPDPHTGKDIEIPPGDRVLKAVLEEAEIIAPKEYFDALQEWNDAIIGRFWNLSEYEGRPVTLPCEGVGGEKSPDDVRKMAVEKSREKALNQLRVAMLVSVPDPEQKKQGTAAS